MYRQSFHGYKDPVTLRPLCLRAFMYAYSLTNRRLTTLRDWVWRNGMLSWEHGLKGERSNRSVDPARRAAAVNFLQQTGITYGLVLPGSAACYITP